MDFKLTVEISLEDVIREIVIDYIKSTVNKPLPIQVLKEVTRISMTLITSIYEGPMEETWKNVARGNLTIFEARGFLANEVVEFLRQGWPPLKAIAKSLQDKETYSEQFLVPDNTWG